MKRVAVIGGGISGVTAAYACTLDPLIECVLFETSARLGGTLLTKRVKLDGVGGERGEFIVELGPDGWVSEKPWARALAVELGLESDLVWSNDAERQTLLLRDGELQAFPEGMRMMVPLDDDAVRDSALLSDAAKQAYLSEPARAEELRSAACTMADISVADFVRSHFGEEVTRTFAGPLLAGVFGGDIEQLSAQSVMPAFVTMAKEHGSLVTALRSRATAHTQDRPGGIFTALRSGNDSLIHAMAALLPEGCVRLNNAVLSVARDGPGWRVTTATGFENFGAVMLATPAHVTQSLLEPIDNRLAELHGLHSSSGVMVALLYDRRVPLPRGFGFLVEQPQTRCHPALLAATFSHQKYPHSAPRGGMLLRVFFGGASVSTVETMHDAALAELAQQQLRSILPGLPHSAAALIQRWPASLPQYEVGHEDRAAEIEMRVAGLPGLFLLGNAYRGVGIPDMVRRARASASLVA